MTTHKHDEPFCLTCSLSAIAPLLPRQGPIKDFFHQNLLQVFIEEPFHEALQKGCELYGARRYMDLSFYRAKLRAGEIDTRDLECAIEQEFDQPSAENRTIINHALMTYVDVFDEKTLVMRAKKLRVSPHLVAQKKERLLNLFYPSDQKKGYVRNVLNETLGFTLDHDVNTILFRLLGSFLDQGVSLWTYLDEHATFTSAVLALAQDSAFPLAYFVDNQCLASDLAAEPAQAVQAILARILPSTEFFHDYVHESLFMHPGWSGMVEMIAQNPASLAKKRAITLQDLFVVKLVLEWQCIRHRTKSFTPLCEHALLLGRQGRLSTTTMLSRLLWLLKMPNLGDHVSTTLIEKISAPSLQRTFHVAFENSYYRSIARKFVNETTTMPTHPKEFQAVFCIDDRECSFRRHLEHQSDDIETLAFPGFFGIEYYLKSHRKDILEKMCPPPVTPKFVVSENVQENSKIPNRKLFEFASFITRHGANSTLVGFVSAYTIGHLSAFRLLLSFLHPFKMLQTKRTTKREEKTSLSFKRDDNAPMQKGLYFGYTISEMADRIFTSLRNMGLTKDFAPMVFLIGHGSSSVNNPHFAAYDCGACSGRPGGINARLFARMANMAEVRALVRNQGIEIPKDTLFVGGLHDTCTDDVTFFEVDKLPADKQELFNEFTGHIDETRKLNAIERCRRFALVAPNITGEAAITEVHHRAKGLFEPRPEMGHANNALCVVGRRSRTYKMNFDRRAFFQSYDPIADASGQILSSIMTAVIPVCGGISFDYFFSRIDPAVYGCGTKLSHNVCSLIGVGNGLDDDLRTGIPIQMTELHDPLRLLIIIEQTPEVIMQAILPDQGLAPWVINDWMKIASLSLESNELYLIDFKNRSVAPMTS